MPLQSIFHHQTASGSWEDIVLVVTKTPLSIDIDLLIRVDFDNGVDTKRPTARVLSLYQSGLCEVVSSCQTNARTDMYMYRCTNWHKINKRTHIQTLGQAYSCIDRSNGL